MIDRSDVERSDRSSGGERRSVGKNGSAELVELWCVFEAIRMGVVGCWMGVATTKSLLIAEVFVCGIEQL